MPKVLIIEDNAVIRENIAELLRLERFEVLSAENGRSGLEMAGVHFPDLILCDVCMPGLSGFDVFSDIKNDARLHNVPFVFLTGKSEDKCKGIDAGADDVITKPFSPNELISIVKNIIQKHLRSKEMIGAEQSRYAEELNRMLVMISHGIRSPLCSCLGLVELLKIKSEAGNEDLLKIIEGIKSATVQLDVFTRDFSDHIQHSLSKQKHAITKNSNQKF